MGWTNIHGAFKLHYQRLNMRKTERDLKLLLKPSLSAQGQRNLHPGQLIS